MKRFTDQGKCFIWLLVLTGLMCACTVWSSDIRSTPAGIQPLEVQEPCTMDGVDWSPEMAQLVDDGRKKHTFVITGRFLDRIPSGSNIYIQLRSGGVSLHQNGTLVFQNRGGMGNNENTPIFSAQWLSVYIPELTQEDEITVTIWDVTERTARGLLKNLYAGDGVALLKAKLWGHIWQIVISGVLMVAGLAYGLTLLALRKVQDDIQPNFVFCALLLVSGAVCTAIDYDYITLLFDNAAFVNGVDCLTQSVVYVALMLYLKIFLSKRQNRIAVNCFAGAAAAGMTFYCIMEVMQWENGELVMDGILLSAVLMIIVTLVLLAVENHRELEEPIKLLFLSCAVLCIATAAEMLHFFLTSVYWIEVFQMGLLFFATVQFLLLFQNAREKLLLAKQTERRLADSRMSVMLSQIQPHFLYNVLGTIAELCSKNPKLAKQATIDFSEYLRGNMNSLMLHHPISFEEELKHLRVYLALEKMRFGDMLNIIYDIQTTDFKLPALSVQPIVENAVKYGVGMAEDGGTVKITVYETEQYIVVRVDDDGVGFDPMQKQYDGRTHIGIENVRDRLAAMVNGTISIKSTKGVGTEVEMTIPKGER